MLQAVMTFFTGGVIIYASFRDAKKAATLVQKREFQLIGILGVGLAMVNICFVINEQLTPYFGGNLSIFYYLGWTFAYIDIIFAYLGFIMPSWLREFGNLGCNGHDNLHFGIIHFILSRRLE